MALLVSKVKDLVVSSVSDGKLDTSEILKIGMAVEAMASSVVGLSFDEKKALVLKVVEKALTEHLPAAALDALGAKVALQLLPTVLDIAVKAVAVVEPVKSCLFSCFSTAETAALAPTPVSELKKALPAPVIALQILQPVSSEVTPVSSCSDDVSCSFCPNDKPEAVAEVVAIVAVVPVAETPVVTLSPVEETPVKEDSAL